MKPHLLSLCVVLLAATYHADGLAVMSVDFGSEFLKIAIVKPGVPMEIVLNKESNRKTPALVALKDGERSFGDPAVNTGMRYPGSVYRYLLDVLGKHYDNPLVRRYEKRFPYYQLEKDPETGAVLFKNDDGSLYSVEQLIAMILQKAKEYAETFTEQPISEAVITVPPYFNQAERRAMQRATELAGLKLLQLINDNTAVALNYGVFRRKIFNATEMNYMFFDMGASSTTATVVSYQIVKQKSPTSGVVDTFPQLTIRGVGFDRSLGGADFQHRLTDHLASLFNEMKKKKGNDVTKDVRAMQKLYKEAGRLKHVLSANVDHFAQVESLLDEEDFRAKVTRETFESLCSDLFPRINKVISSALDMSQVGMGEISEVILMGGGTRVPKVQEVLQKAIGRTELGKGINSDEAAALGAVYQAAHLGKGFKVKKFAVKEATIYPIQVEFDRVKSAEDTADGLSDSSKVVRRNLFGRTQPYPQKKIMTFNKHVKDFQFHVNYVDLNFLDGDALLELGGTSLMTVSLQGVEDAHNTYTADADSVSKGVKAHFRVDDSGIFHLDKVESLFEKAAAAEPEEQSTFSKIGSTISNLFGGSKTEEGMVEENKEESIGGAELNETSDTSEEGKMEETATLPDNERGDEKPIEEDNQKPVEGKTDSNVEDEQRDDAADDDVIESESDEKTSSSDQSSNGDSSSDSKSKSDTSDTADAGPSPDDAKSDKDSTRDDSTKTTEGGKSNGDKTGADANKDNDKESKKNETDKTDNATLSTDKKDKKPKIVTMRADIKSEIITKDLADPSVDKLKESKKLIDDLRKKDEEKGLLEKARNEIEAFVFEFQDKLEQPDYKKCSKEEERIDIGDKLNTVSDWLNEQDDTTPRKEYENKLKDMKSLTRDLYSRVYEMKERPAAIDALNRHMNHTEFFLTNMRNFTNFTGSTDLPFTLVEFEALEKLVNDTKEWNRTVHVEQAKTPLTEKPKFTVEDVETKIMALDREVKYLLNKLKSYRPKKPKEESPSKANKTTTTEKKRDKPSASNETKSDSKDYPSLDETLLKKPPSSRDKESSEESPLDKDILDDDILPDDTTDRESTSDTQPDTDTTEKPPNDEL